MKEVEAAEKAWEAAPLHVKAMAGAYVGPLLDALRAIADKIKQLEGEKHGSN